MGVPVHEHSPQDLFAALLTEEGQRVLADADPDADRLAEVTRLRRFHRPELVGPALTQARLRARAADKFGTAADTMYFTADGLEQATRTEVAAHRARRFARLGADTDVADLCCGIGADLIALARAGHRVSGVERDPLTAAVARANLAALGLTGAHLGDATANDPRGYAAVFCDPARRTTGGTRRRIFDPAAYSPPLPTAVDLAGRGRGGCLKVAPGIPHEAVPDGAEAEWVSWHGAVKEAVLWLGAFAGPATHRATLLPSGATLFRDAGLAAPDVAPVGRYLYEPDGAVIRAHLVAETAAGIGGTLLDPAIAYLSADRLVRTPFARAYEVTDVLAFSVKRLRAVLRDRHVGTVTIKKRGSAIDVDRLRRDLRPAGPATATVVCTRIGTRPYAIICHPV